jgi:hypothetical protein
VVMQWCCLHCGPAALRRGRARHPGPEAVAGTSVQWGAGCVSGARPRRQASLPDLTELSGCLCVHDNNLSRLPDTLGRLSRLLYLNVGYVGENPLADLPETIGRMTELIELRAQHSPLTTLPTDIGRRRLAVVVAGLLGRVELNRSEATCRYSGPPSSRLAVCIRSVTDRSPDVGTATTRPTPSATHGHADATGTGTASGAGAGRRPRAASRRPSTASGLQAHRASPRTADFVHGARPPVGRQILRAVPA